MVDPNSPPSGRPVHGGRAPDLRRPSQQWKAPPPGDALPPPPQRAMPARKGARCGPGAASPRPHRLVAESPGFTRLGAPSLPGFPVSPLPGQCINSQPWLRVLTHRVAPLMRGRPGRRRRRARATGLSPVGPPWAGPEAALPRGWGVAQCATTALAGAVPSPCVRGARGWFGGLGPVPGVVSLSFPPSRPACAALRVAGRPVRVSLTLARWYAIPRGLCVPRARSGCPSGRPRVPLACVCARAPAASAPPPPGWCGVRTSRGPCPSACPAPVPCPVWRALGRAVRSRFLPTWLGLHVLWGLRAAAVVGGRPRREWPATVVKGVWCQALSLPRQPVLWGGQPGFRDPCVPGAVGAGVGTQHRFHSVRPCRLALLAVGLAGGRPRGEGAFHSCEGRLRSGPPPPPTAQLLGGLLGSTTYMLWAQACGCGGPSLPLWPACPVGAACRGGAWGPSPGGWPATVARGVWCQALSLPLPLVLWGGRPGSHDPCVWGAVAAGVGTQHRSHSVCPCGPALLAVGLAEGRSRGGAFHRCEGRLRSGAPPPPTARLLGGLLGSATHVLWAGGASWRVPH